MKKPVVEIYESEGDLVKCNFCDKIMLLPTGADKCPSCYVEGCLGWYDEKRENGTSSELNDDEFEIVYERDLEIHEYLSDEVLIEEFDMAPDPEYKTKHKIFNP